jgi:hypothetical protein
MSICMNMNLVREVGQWVNLGEVRGQMYELEEEVWSMRNNDETHGNETMVEPKEDLRPTSDEGPGSNFLGANLD